MESKPFLPQKKKEKKRKKKRANPKGVVLIVFEQTNGHHLNQWYLGAV